jgi:hypothetical protein
MPVVANPAKHFDPRDLVVGEHLAGRDRSARSTRLASAGSGFTPLDWWQLVAAM